MATYTHDFEIKLDGVTIEGEICFDHGSNGAFRTTLGEEMTISQHAEIQGLLEEFMRIATRFTNIEKIEIVKKVV